MACPKHPNSTFIDEPNVNEFVEKCCYCDYEKVVSLNDLLYITNRS